MKRSLLLCLLALTIIGVSACGEQTAAEIEVLPTVSAVSVRSMDLVEEIRASGELKALYHTTIASEIEGRVTQIRIEEGSEIEFGAIVLEIDPARRKLDRDAAKARLAQARAQLAKQQSQTDRIRKLRDKSISSEQQLEEAETALLLDEANVEAERASYGVARRALADASVKAPFAGFVARRMVQLGEFVQKGTPLFELVSLDPLEVEFSVPEREAVRVENGVEVAVIVEAWRDRSFAGFVKFVSPTVDPETRTLRIRAEIDNRDGSLRPGLFARVNLGVSERSGVTMVPEEALIQRSTGAWLFKLLPDQRVKRLEVATGSIEAGLVEVRGDLRPGERVIRRGHGGLTDGAMVRVLEDERSGAPPAVAAGKDGRGAGL